MKQLMSAVELRAAAVDLLRAIASIPKRRYFWFLVTAIAGYSVGYQDAFRGPESLGWKFSALVDRLTPGSIIEERRRNAEALRQRTQHSIELPE
jgi:hypothetical protein